VSWGGGEYGQLGHGTQCNETVPKLVLNLHGVICISGGLRHSAAVTGDGLSHVPTLWTWGDNSYGQLGLGDTDIRLCPTLVTASTKMRVLSASAGDRHTLAVTSHIPMVVSQLHVYKEYFQIMEVIIYF
jgi:alpha-tubulin suppressor-like RCC1 family protein